MKISIIVAVRESNPFLLECIRKCLQLAYEDYEIIVLPDNEFVFVHERVRIMPTGPCLPAQKRDIGGARASGEILAFLDDDAYPAPDWLMRAARHFKDADVAAVGGPAVTPPTESFLSRASGRVYSSILVSGPLLYRYQRGKARFVDDYPSCNLLIRRDVFETLGGFKTNFWPGEDTLLCLEVTRRLKKKIVYDPDVLVFHHRRPLFLPHLKQITNYALHRGYFVKRFPRTSLRGCYFLPSFVFLWVLSGPFLSLFIPRLFVLYAAAMLAYLLTVIIFSWQRKDLKMTGTVAAGICLTHLFYGAYFLLGLISRKLKEERA